ncbi:hypothetical protein CSR02_04505 [Acetobacter pomorum]|uniref:Uncharacterized protein n=1 Tax=Acetobacter pomorum TaxID=65959 RepID=A0A2G4RGF1_9PROT|nr:hypothetical protein CSR02_04505 [Acetobacter pomorum]
MIACSKDKELDTNEKSVHLATMGSAGLVGILGFILLRKEGWGKTSRPWLGLSLIASHGIAGVRSRKAVQHQDKKDAVQSGILQILMVILAACVFTTKPHKKV